MKIITYTKTGKYKKLGSGGWRGTKQMAYLGGSLYIVDGGTIWKTSPVNGKWKRIGKKGDWRSITAMAADNERLYIVCNGLYKVNPSTGKYKKLGSGSWTGKTFMVAR